MSNTTKKSTFQNNNQQTTQMSSSFHQSTKNGQGTSTDQLIQLMGQVNGAVKAGDFSNELGNNIFTLCQQLKNNGQKLESSNKSDLNNVFFSLRKVCCRDNGQLGTPCRLKIMELIELRAMGWKTNLSHSQYYLNKAEKVNGQSDIQTQNFSSSSSTKNYQSNSNNSQKPTQSNFGQQQLYQPPPMQAVPQQFGNFSQPPPLYLPPEMTNQPQIQQPAPSYFLIPAAGAWTPQMIPSGMLPSPQFSHQIRQPPPQQLPPDWLRQVAAAHFKGPPLQNSMSQSAYLPGSSSTLNSKSIKQPQLREEVTIKNSDSGKIMGVKGRRVAAVEEISKTVISFQKVDGHSRYRALAITGTTQESIQHAKRLIEETIKRNVSPNKIYLDGPDTAQQSAALLTKVVGEEKNEDSLDDEEDDEPGISIEANKDGTLKVSCADPEMLQAAQQALTEYLNLRTNRMSAEERELRKERRKSMPLQSSSNTVPAQNVVPKIAEEAVKSNGSLSDSHKKLTGSTPNLLADSIVSELETSQKNSDVLRYERNEMLLVKDQVQTQLKSEPQTDSKFDKTQLPFTKGSKDEVEEKTDG